ncbi:serine hydrolase domain-containing protein [Streptacidiphilus sp. N1-3]|uniref:Serine hydrolase domain-containing protein n=1 Tax=Streptacidiphilus alkalitolerans TaxID=3342712 RepID=A0ABV6WUF0_9ACTN
MTDTRAVGSPGSAGDRLRQLMRSLSEQGTMPGVSVACGVREREAFRSWTGDACRQGGPPRRVDEHTRYDAASLTKVMSTLPIVLRLHAAGVIDINAPVSRWLPELANPYREQMTVRHLLTHTAGLITHQEYWRQLDGYTAVLDAVLREPPAAPPGTVFAYSDLGYIMLGEILRRATGEELPALFAAQVSAPLGLRVTSFLPTAGNIAATEVKDGVAVEGRVHDENARAMGGVAGHAGLFTDLGDAAATAAAWAQSAPTLLPADLAQEAVTRQPMPDTSSARALGWVCASDENWDHIGPSWPRTTVSHTGFTGVSIAADPVSGWWAAVLSNAVHSGRERPRLRRARLDLHATIADLLTRRPADRNGG